MRTQAYAAKQVAQQIETRKTARPVRGGRSVSVISGRLSGRPRHWGEPARLLAVCSGPSAT